eukprot:CAMPEP_0204490262 /NCGR_PEP_ID=MMETSP0471-20130131/74396_1 /ASSEMBLY_ACC=CAM_ASM_000602 /TAXON_ID=2969 /ORGANISM="Oxyrrhis marina" /LENGTH=106 /DNA_ID=CAMNT_0051494171 /DNA_START=71 /DNA_END=389 /DNA_ORIENTATION=-
MASIIPLHIPLSLQVRRRTRRPSGMDATRAGQARALLHTSDSLPKAGFTTTIDMNFGPKLVRQIPKRNSACSPAATIASSTCFGVTGRPSFLLTFLVTTSSVDQAL